MGQTGQGAMSRCMGITTDYGHTGHSRAQLRAHHMHNALTHFIDLKFFDAIKIAVIIESLHLNARYLIDSYQPRRHRAQFIGRYIMIGRGNIGIQSPRHAPRHSQPFKGLR